MHVQVSLTEVQARIHPREFSSSCLICILHYSSRVMRISTREVTKEWMARSVSNHEGGIRRWTKCSRTLITINEVDISFILRKWRLNCVYLSCWLRQVGCEYLDSIKRFLYTFLIHMGIGVFTFWEPAAKHRVITSRGPYSNVVFADFAAFWMILRFLQGFLTRNS